MTPDQLRSITAELKRGIDDNSVADAAADQAPRWHLGISQIGQACLRATWYDFRWFSARRLRGFQARLLARGKREEEKIVAMLRRFGFTVLDLDPATGKQFLYSAVHGHYGGECDGLISHPLLFDGDWLLLEMKTHNTKSFGDVLRNGVVESKPQHYLQMCGYGKALRLKFGLYFAVNKNDDDIQPEIVPLDDELADQMELRAESLILARSPPNRISNKPTDWRCKSCDHFAVCHAKAAPETNCRTCAHSWPVEGGEWLCSLRNAAIPRDVARIGCPSWQALLSA